MGESSSSANLHPSAGDAPARGPAHLVRLGAIVGMAGCGVGILVLFAACAGFDAALPFSLTPLGLGVVGLVLSLGGALQVKSLVAEDAHVLASLFVNALAILGGLLEMAVWLKWAIFPVNG